jgi:hypothetical protein
MKRLDRVVRGSGAVKLEVGQFGWAIFVAFVSFCSKMK